MTFDQWLQRKKGLTWEKYEQQLSERLSTDEIEKEKEMLFREFCKLLTKRWCKG